MSQMIGITYNRVWANTNTALTTAFVQASVGTTVDAKLQNMLSANDGSLQNDSGKTQTVNGRMLFWCETNGTAGVDTIFSVATSSDGVTYTEVNSNFHVVEQSNSRRHAVLIDYQLDLADGDYVAPVVKSSTGTNTFTTTYFVHECFSVEGGVVAPKIAALIESTYDNTYYQDTLGTANEKIEVVTADSNSVGVTTDNIGGITNDCGETVAVSVWLFASCTQSTGNDLIMRPYIGRNGTGGRAEDTDGRAEYDVSNREVPIIWAYIDEFAHGDYVQYCGDRPSGGAANFRTWSLQVEVRSLT